MPDPPSEDEIQRLVATQPGMLKQAAGLLKGLLRKDLSPRNVRSRAAELKIQADENLATLKKLHANRDQKNEDEHETR
jgi:uncharacterized protein (UPF0147 family)